MDSAFYSDIYLEIIAMSYTQLRKLLPLVIIASVLLFSLVSGYSAPLRGEDVFMNRCASCHGINGEGSNLAPSLRGVSNLMVDFQISTGRMPATSDFNGQIVAVKGALTDKEREAVSEYVKRRFGDGNEAHPAQYMPDKKLISEGGELFRRNCASCHNFAAKGGALSDGRFAVPINASPKQIYEAMMVGPGEMPIFNTLSESERRAVISYIHYVLQKNENQGGISLGRFGPVGEGAIAWIIIMVTIVGISVWITTRR